VPVADTLKRELPQRRNMPLLTELGNVLGCACYKDVAPMGLIYFSSLLGLTQQQSYVTASRHRPQIVGCAGFLPMSVSQCQQRSHFWPSALETSIITSLK
jgi:hypothetical protein